MNLFIILISIPVIWIILLIVYRQKKPVKIPEEKPVISFFPKYYATVRMTDSILKSNNPFSITLDSRLEPFGFKLTKEFPEELIFSRGSVSGDFSIKITKVNLKFKIPPSKEIRMDIEYGFMVLFDTGDLWKFTNELIEKLQKGLTV
ncbi:MAG: hypothetical protein JW827_10520 [Spirochaetes bacterium]|nr:hypothetical protein [Spirochaetota bacterium]